MSGLFRRRRFDVVQIQNGEVVKVHERGVSRGRALSSAAEVDRFLLMCKLLAPSGPQDARAEIREVSQ